MTSSSLVVPLAFWNRLPTAPVTVAVYREGHVVTGLKDGNIWIYRCNVDDQADLQLRHKVLCIGHKSAITALSIIEGQVDGCAGNNYVLLSASEDGWIYAGFREVMKWCLLDGRCMMSTARAFDGIIRSLKPLAAYAEPTKFILCAGFLNEITILNCATLEIVRIWAGHNDWVTCTPFYDSDTRKIRLLSSNFNGILKIWTFDETKQTITKEHDNVGFLDAQGDKILELISNPYEIGVIMAITKNFVIVFIIRNGKLINMQRIRAPGEGIFWTSGVFLAKNRVLVSSQNGDAFLYSIPTVERKYPSENGHLLTKPGLIRRSSMPNLQKSNGEKLLTSVYSRPELLEVVRSGSEDSTSVTVTSVFANPSIEGKSTCWYLIAFRNHPQGISFAWKSLSTTTKDSDTGENSQRNVRESKWHVERYLSDIWPLNKHKSPNITATTIVDDDKIAFGFENGEIRMMPISLAFIEEPQICSHNAVRDFKGHVGSVTCLLTPTFNNSVHRYLVSGGEDCSVRIWSLENGKRLASFTYHSQPVIHLFEPPAEIYSRIRGCIISVARDNSLAIISLEEMSCIYVFGGYPYPIEKIQWRISDHFLVLYYGDESAHFWQMRDSELYQIVASARELIKDENWITSSVPPKLVDNKKNSTLTSFPVYSKIDGTSTLQMFTINVKQLINDIYHYHVPQFGSRINKINGQTEDFDEKPNLPKIFSWTTAGASQSSISSQTSTIAESESKAIDASIVQVIISSLMSWNIDSSLDKICFEKLGLKKSSTRITFGLRGVNGNLSIAAPSLDDVHATWKISNTLTAANLLSIVGLTRSFLSMKGLEKYTSDIITHYCSLLPDLVGTKFKHPSLVFLVKYFQDPVEDIRLSARALFSSALNSMSPAEQQSVIDYWKQFLPSVMTPDSYTNQYMARSTILLGMIGADNPKVLPKKLLSLLSFMDDSTALIAKNIALSLLLLLHDDCKLSHRLAALELLAVLKTILGFAIEVDSNAVTVKAMAQKVIFQIASMNAPLCMSTLAYDSNNSKKPNEKNGYLKLISLFIRKKPLIMYSNLSPLVESVVKSLDPNIPKMRDTVLQTTTSVLHDLVRTFPSISFHGGSQKLAVGTLEGASIVYDLRTATRCHILEGHTKSVTAVTFSNDGRIIVSCSLEEGTVRVWNPNPGFLDMITGVGSRNGINGVGSHLAFSRNENKGIKMGMGFKNSLSSSIKPIKNFDFNLGEDGETFLSFDV
ncbi:16598_t:CDS:10 [Acaulospora morrowiae]|uniref:16598_t:CDS:1 n=1 Tax=Acaulospora morrowiae TaxID=94023 RepID=A0A9N8VF70_9GLOM|nr:16598_t:CDS:10 [Acaulospora morrowiae]